MKVEHIIPLDHGKRAVTPTVETPFMELIGGGIDGIEYLDTQASHKSTLIITKLARTGDNFSVTGYFSDGTQQDIGMTMSIGKKEFKKYNLAVSGDESQREILIGELERLGITLKQVSHNKPAVLRLIK